MSAGKSFTAAARLFLLGAGSALTWAALSVSPALADDSGLLSDISDVTSAVVAGDPASEEPVPAPAPGLLPAAPSADPAPVGLIAEPEPLAEVIEHVAVPVEQVAAPITGVVSTVEQLAAPVAEPVADLIEPVTVIIEPVAQGAGESLPVPLIIPIETGTPASVVESADEAIDVVVALHPVEPAENTDAVNETILPEPENSVRPAQAVPADRSIPEQSTREQSTRPFKSPVAAHEVARGEPTASLVNVSPIGPSPLGVTAAPSVGASSGSGGAVGLALLPSSWSALPTWFVLTGQPVTGGFPSGPSFDPGSTPD